MRFRPATLLLAPLFTATSLTLTAACLGAPPAGPATAPASPQLAKPPSLPAGVRVERDIAYVPDGDPAQRLDLYLPEQASVGGKPLPVIVWVHGGGWRGGSKANPPAVAFVPRGYAVASVGYRFSQKAVFPAQIQDCQAAVRWLRANAKTYNLDPDRVGAWGASAGGHLVALLGTAGGKQAFPPIGGNADQSDRVQAVVDVYGPANFNTVVAQAAADTQVKNIYPFNTPKDPYSSLIGIALDADPAKTNAVSPVFHVSKESPPTLILHGTKDEHVPYAQSVEFAAALKQAGVPVVLQTIPNAGHGGPGFGSNALKKLVADFFDKHLKGADVTVEPLPPEAVTVTPKGK